MFLNLPQTLLQSTRARMRLSWSQPPSESSAGNSSPKFIRVSTWNIPNSSRLAEDLSIPLVAIIQPFAELDDREEPIPLVQTGEFGSRSLREVWRICESVVHLGVCANIDVGLTPANGKVEPHYFSALDANFARLDYLERPELRKGTIDFDVSQWTDYWASNPLKPPSTSPADPALSNAARNPQSMRYVFVLDVSDTSMRSGFLASACVALRAILYGRVSEDGSEVAQACLPSCCTIALVTFEDVLHFYELSPNQTSPRQLVVADVDDVFPPLPPTALFVDPHQCRAVIESLLDNLQQRHASMSPGVTSRSCLGSALRVSLDALAYTGGHVVSFISTLPGLGPGRLVPLEKFNRDEAWDDIKFYVPRDIEWNNLGEACADAGVGVSMFMAPTKFLDIGSIGAVPSLSGGDIFYHWDFKPARDGPIMESQLRRLVTRKTGYNCSIRVRASNGLRVEQLAGNFHLPSPSMPTSGTLDADQAISVSFNITATLSTHQHAFIQCAVLHTTVDGLRQIRVINLALQVTDLAGNVFRFADMDAVVAHFTRHCNYRPHADSETVHNSRRTNGRVLRDLVFVSSILRFDNSGDSAKYIEPDVRNYHRHKLRGASVRNTLFHLYPRLLAVHDLDDTIALPHPETGVIDVPSLMRNSHTFVQENGIYLIDNEELQVVWVGQSASPQLLLDLFGVDDIFKVDIRITELPILDNRLSKQVRNIIGRRREERGGRVTKLLIARQNFDAAEIEFGDMLMEDHNNAAWTYPEYLAMVHKRITTALQRGMPLSPGAHVRAPW
ncbi:protein transporter SEC24 [Russula earlei]|uniref:Protein transporter SEC24 n=1 Tax=Russula earlei TaxID=71964 RepID=A0ACC0U6W6_9AGAM|nr:protein transporter SEC24 [Russula earlei]